MVKSREEEKRRWEYNEKRKGKLISINNFLFLPFGKIMANTRGHGKKIPLSFVARSCKNGKTIHPGLNCKKIKEAVHIKVNIDPTSAIFIT